MINRKWKCILAMSSLLCCVIVSVCNLSHEKEIIIQYDEVYDNEIIRAIELIQNTTIDKRDKVFVLVNHCEQSTTMTFSLIEKMSETIKEQIFITRRKMALSNGMLLPIIFSFDDSKQSFIRKPEVGVNHGNIHGIVLQFSSDGEVLISASDN